jgi:hypothetical protein
MSTRRLLAVAVTLTALAIPLACGGASDSDSDSATSSADSDQRASETGNPALPPPDGAQRLPPNDIAYLRRLYDPVLEPMGVRITYGGLSDPARAYAEDNNGTHLALYVEPTGSYSTEQYVDGLWTISALMTPDVFARWPELLSFDVCQEPRPGEDDSDKPPPVTQILLTREQSQTIDWENGDLVDLLVAKELNPKMLVNINTEIRRAPGYGAAVAAARTRAGASTIPG